MHVILLYYQSKIHWIRGLNASLIAHRRLLSLFSFSCSRLFDHFFFFFSSITTFTQPEIFTSFFSVRVSFSFLLHIFLFSVYKPEITSKPTTQIMLHALNELSFLHNFSRLLLLLLPVFYHTKISWLFLLLRLLLLLSSYTIVCNPHSHRRYFDDWRAV